MRALHQAGKTHPPSPVHRARGDQAASAGVRGLVARVQERGADAADRVGRLPGAGAVTESLATEQRHGAPLLAGGLAYRLFFWLVAFGLLLASALSFWVRSSAADVKAAAESFGLVGVAASSATSAVNSGSHARWYFLIAGLWLIVYFGVGAVRALYVTSAIAWQLDPVRLRRPLRKSVAFSAGMFGILAVSLAGQWVREHAPGIGLIAVALTGTAPFVVALIGFALLPHGPVSSWRVLWPGALEFALGFEAMHLFVTFYLADKLERSPDLYGALGAATVVLLWLFLFGRLLVSGIFLNATIERRRRAA